MNYKSVFRFLIIVPILFIFVAVGLDFAYPFPESVGSYYGDLAAFGFSWKYWDSHTMDGSDVGQKDRNRRE